MVLSACEIKVSKVQTNNTMNGVIMLPQRAIIEHTPMPVFLERKKKVCLGVRTCELVFCFAPFVFLGSIVLTSLSSLFYVTGEFYRFLHRRICRKRQLFIILVV